MYPLLNFILMGKNLRQSLQYDTNVTNDAVEKSVLQ